MLEFVVAEVAGVQVHDDMQIILHGAERFVHLPEEGQILTCLPQLLTGCVSFKVSGLSSF